MRSRSRWATAVTALVLTTGIGAPAIAEDTRSGYAIDGDTISCRMAAAFA